RIKSAPKHYAVAALAVVAIAVAAVIVTVYSKTGGTDVPAASYRLSFADRSYNLSVAVTGAEQERGLSGRDNLPGNQGMLFWYPDSQERCFWMKDMQFPLDIMWVSADKKVVKLAENVQPDTYPEAFCAKAQYVIELNAGQAERNRLQQGQSLNF
ncbi:MAG TPA: DUF192 domain-containing protein, partial [Candidatus Saccharimonadales bacterium]|nr:DUF192 domain-containing protein [Candidatus Saccharimonadales bacterium]